MKVNVRKRQNFTEKDRKKLGHSVHVLESVLGSATFKEAVREFSHNGKSGFFFRKDARGNYIDQFFTNEEVYQRIRAAVEKLGNVVDGECDLHLEIDNRRHSTVVGYTYPTDKTIYTYRNWFTSFGAIGYACHLAHEWCHKLGFTHDENRSKNREYSVPYAIGNLIGIIYPELHVMDSNGFPELY